MSESLCKQGCLHPHIKKSLQRQRHLGASCAQRRRSFAHLPPRGTRGGPERETNPILNRGATHPRSPLMLVWWLFDKIVSVFLGSRPHNHQFVIVSIDRSCHSAICAAPMSSQADMMRRHPWYFGAICVKSMALSNIRFSTHATNHSCGDIGIVVSL